MTGRNATVTAYANIKATLGRTQARRALRKVVNAAERRTGRKPDVIGLGEWGRGRMGILRDRFGRYRWVRPLFGGGPVGLNRHRFSGIRVHGHRLTGWTRVEPDPGNPRRLLPPSRATVVTAHDEQAGRDRAWVLYHLTAGVQDRHGRYKTDTHPRRVARHRDEVTGIEELVTVLRAYGFDVEAMGDGNFDGLELHGLTSANPPADLGRRAVSDVFADGPAHAVNDVATDSDHDGLIVTRQDPGEVTR